MRTTTRGAGDGLDADLGLHAHEMISDTPVDPGYL
jgi:hypothetical protein